MAAPMDQVGPAVADRAKTGENRDLLLDRPQRFQLRHDFISAAGLARNPACAARGCVGQAEPPEISSEPHRQLRSIGVDCASAVEEPVQDGNTYANGCALQHTAQERAPVEMQAHGTTPLDCLGGAVSADAVDDLGSAPLGTTALKKAGLEAILTMRSGRRYPLPAKALVWPTR